MRAKTSVFPRKAWASFLLVAMAGLAGCAATPPAFSTMNTQKPVPAVALPQPARQVALPYLETGNQDQPNPSMRAAQLAQARGIWRYAMKKDRMAAVACLSGSIGAVDASTAQNAMATHSGGSKWVYRNGRYVRDRMEQSEPSSSHASATTDEGSQDGDACVRFVHLLSDQALQMQSVSAPRDVLRYFRAAKSWAMDCAALGPADAGCSGDWALSNLRGMKASALNALEVDK